MKLIFTDNFSITTAGTLIQKGAIAGNGVMPNDLDIRTVRVELVTATDTIAIRGINEASNWVTQGVGQGFLIERFRDSDVKAFYIKASTGTVSVNLYCEGE